MKHKVQFFLKIIFILGIFHNIYGAQTTISNKKEPKIVYDDITPTNPKKLDVKTEIKPEIKNEIKIDSLFKNSTEESKIINPIEKEKQIENNNSKSLQSKPTQVDYTNEVNEKKETIKKLVKDSNKILLEDTKNQKDTFEESIPPSEQPIAFIYASANIGKYAIETSNVAMTYLVNKNSKFQLEFFDIGNESKENIITIFDQLAEKKIKKVICMFTSNSMWIVNSYPNIGSFNIYFPLIHKTSVSSAKPNYIFGGIDYTKQFEYFASIAKKNLVEIYDGSGISKSLHEKLLKLNLPNIKYVELKGENPNYSILYAKSNGINNATVILNTSVVRSAIILALLRGQGINPDQVFATQLNYTPLIFNLTQEEDRTNLYVANSIALLPRDLEELISFYGDDPLFSWVNYSTLLGLEYFMTKKTKLFGNIEIVKNQVNYPIKLYGFEGTKFIDVTKK